MLGVLEFCKNMPKSESHGLEIYMELDPIFKPCLEFLNFVKTCQNQNLMD
jgi:hypothetical protein